MNILALYICEEVYRKKKGGNIVEYNISDTDKQISARLKAIGHNVAIAEYSRQFLKSSAKNYDIIFNLCDGLEGDNTFQEIKILRDIEETGIPFTGNNANAVKKCNDKGLTKRILITKGLRTPRFQIFRTGKEKLKDLNFPLFVKPLKSDAAYGIKADSFVRTEKKAYKKIKEIIKVYKLPALVEEYIDGREFSVPVVGCSKSLGLPPIEIRYGGYYTNKPKILSYTAKWNFKSRLWYNVETIVPKDITGKLKKKLCSTAWKSFKALKCSGYGTVDMKVDVQGRIFVLEVNPNCYIGPNCDSAKAAKEMGMDYGQFLQKIVELGMERKIKPS